MNLIVMLAMVVLLALIVGWSVERGRRVIAVNVAEGTRDTGARNYRADAAHVAPFLFVKVGSDAAHAAVIAAVTDVPLGVTRDQPDAAEDLFAVDLFGCTAGTKLALTGGVIAAGNEISSDAAGKAVVLPTAAGTYYVVGRALSAAASGGLVEFVPCYPRKVVVS